MVDDVYEPLSRYRDEFKGRFAELTRAKLAELRQASRVDVPANRRQVTVVRGLEERLASQKNQRLLFGVLIAVGFLLSLGAFLFLGANDALDDGAVLLLALALVGGVALAIWSIIRFRDAQGQVARLERAVAREKTVAWQQMAPLNALFTWDLTLRLIERTVPRIKLENYLTARRLDDLRRLYGWDDDFMADRSVMAVQPGVINGNPFLLCECKEMEWGTETYTGSLLIEWEEEVVDSDGDTQYVTRYETLTASVEKPIPVYSRMKFLAYGNDAAPNLSFSRLPSGLEEKGAFSALKKKWRLSRLKAHSRNLKDDSDFTLMSNHDFETWFHAKDRDNEVEFRLLYTALAQTQTLQLMKDRQVGYGDDFAFVKQNRLNLLFPQHLANAAVDIDPTYYHDWDYDQIAKKFIEFNEKYFKDLYFALAPLLAIPLYQQTRTHEDIWNVPPSVGEESADWEHEATANAFGDDRFEHPACITESLLKTEVVSRTEGSSKVAVTAYGYRGEEQVDFVSVFGGDGEWHEVPVEWVEYLPVEKTTTMTIAEGAASPSRARTTRAKRVGDLLRRTIWASVS